MNQLEAAALHESKGDAMSSKSKLQDKQNERDHRELRIDKVGVRELRFPIQVRDKAKTLQNTVATIAMCVDLPKEFKGTHMSRFLEVLSAHGSVVHVENIPDILFEMQRKLKSATSHLTMEFPFFLEKRAPVSGLSSLMDYVARFEALMEARGIPAALDPADFSVEACCLLCSEATPEQCHRRLVAERLAAHWPDVEIVHL